MPLSDYSLQDGLGLAAWVREGRVSPGELLQEALRRVEKHNPRLNAVVHVADALAVKWANGVLPDGPFRGVPMLLKSIGAGCAGMPSSMGCRRYADFVPRRDGELVARFKKAGFVPFGMTNVPEFGLMPTTESLFHGPARNPWDL